MTTADKLKALESMTGEHDKAVLLTYLSIAGERILQKAYPYRHNIESVPERYAYTQIECAVYLLNKRGAEGETKHSAGDVDRTYETASIPDSMLKTVVPCAGVF